MKPTDFCNQYKACNAGREYAEKFQSMADVWDACERADWLFWILEKHAPLEKEQSVRLTIAIAETALVYVPEGEDRPKLAIEAAKAWLADPTEENRRAAARAARAADAADAAAYAAAYAAAAAADAAYAAAAAADAADAAAAYAADAYAAAAAAADAAAAYAAAYAARAEICCIIRGLISNPFDK